MERFLPLLFFAALGSVARQARRQAAPAAQPKPNADPYANNADPGKLSFPTSGSGRQGQRRDENAAAGGGESGVSRSGYLEARNAL